MKTGILAIALLSLVAADAATSNSRQGELVYSDESHGIFRSLAYKNPGGAKVKIFSDGFDFSYDKADDTTNTSPGKTYSVVQFSESGELTGEQGTSTSESLYYCAFVRLADGCVINVSEGQICGGAWGADERWHITPDGPPAKIDNAPPQAEKVYKSYVSGLKDGTTITKPRILAYLQVGTTVENLLVCDPPNKANKNIYQQLITELKRDRDEANAVKIQKALASSRDDNAATETKSATWTEHTVTVNKAELYASPNSSAVTKAYLVRGDVVSVQPPQANGFMQSRYTLKSGKILERWIRCESINYCGPK
ncbi:hypothetical protein [Xanthomonas maliensis]|uniref:hypothetical protein n=1 Tax=Xanthomonas maliensis TaxID=1321368 RepID=UPI0012642E3F|nr:hypothetical protein [Xanthomonas maliensis]